MGKKGIITVQYDEQGELISVDLGEGELKKPTHKLFDKEPPGVLKGFTNMGKIYLYELPDGTRSRCVHRRCKLF